MAKVIVAIEEHLVKEVEVEIDSDSIDERMQIAEEKVRAMVKNSEIVLTADDYSGTRLFYVEDVESGIGTNWKE